MRRRDGFTLVELLVVIAIVAVLIAILLPAMQQVRESARRMSCHNNLKQIGLALFNYESVHKVLPSSSTSQIDFGVWTSNPTQYHLHSWASVILPYIEQQTLNTQVNYDVSALDPLNKKAASQIISLYRCPSYTGHDYSQSPLYLPLSDRYAIRNYAAMGATTVGKFWKNPDGVFYARSKTRLADIRDGQTVTIFVAETREEDAAVWIDGGTAAITSHRYDDNQPPEYSTPEIGINAFPYFAPVAGQGINCKYGPSSMHPGGVSHLFADGAVHFIAQNIDGKIYDALVTREGKEIVERGDF